MKFHFTLVSELDSDVDIKIDEDSINIEINNIENEIEATMNSLDFISSTIDNLLVIRNHINKFGITPQFLHLVDDNKQLSNSLKMNLEEDSDIGIVVEGLGSAIKKGFEYLIEKIKAFSKWLVGLIPFRKKKVEAAKNNLKKENIVKEATEELKKQQANHTKNMDQVDKNLDELKKSQKENNEALDEMKEIMQELLDKPLPSKIFQEKFFSPEVTKHIFKLFIDANKAWKDGCMEFIITAKPFKIEDINKLFIPAGKDQVKYYYIVDDLLKFDSLTIEEFNKKGYKEPEFMGEDDSKWTINLLEKVGEDIIAFYDSFNAGVSFLKKMSLHLEKIAKDPQTEHMKKNKNNVTEMISLYNSIIDRFNKFVDQYLQVTTHTKKDIIMKAVKESTTHFKNN